MKKALRKDFWMEIRKSYARFISIFLIVALGVAFFSGIQAASPDMRYSGDAYFDEKKLMDLKVVSTMGLTQEDADAMEELEGVKQAVPAYSTDVLCGEDAEQVVLHVESLLTEMNLLTVEQGQLPSKKGECFLDSDFLEEFSYEIGDTIELHEDDDELLAKKKFTIVGAGECPMYISFARGNTTLGSGEVSGFVYVTEDSFDSDVFTQVYVEVEGARELLSHSNAYEELVEQVEKRLEGIQDIRCQIRHDEVVEEANEKLEDARKELEDGRKEADEKLADAKKELEDAEKKLADGQEEYDDGVRQLEDGKKELEDGKKQLEDGRKEYTDGLSKLSAARLELNSQQMKLNESKKELNDGWSQLNAGKIQLDTQQHELDQNQKKLDEQQATLNEQQVTLNTRQEELNSSQQQLEEQKQQLQQQRQELEVQKSEALAGVTDPSMQQSILAQFAQMESQLTAAESQIEDGQQQIKEWQKQIDEGQKQINEGQEQIIKAQMQINEGQNQLNEAYAELNEKTQELNAGQLQLNSGQLQIDNALIEINNNQRKLEDAAREIEENEEKIKDGETEIEENEQKLEDAKKELKKGRKKLKDGQKKYEDAKADAEETIADGQREIIDAQKELDDLNDPEWMISNRDSLPEYSGFGDNADRIHNIGQVFPVLFFLVAALISLTTMTRMVEEQRTQIGTLKALGYRKVDIASKYLMYALTATVGGSILGVLIGEKLLPYIIIISYGIMYIHMPAIVIPYELKYSLIASGAALACTVLAALSSCYKELLETPASLMRPPTPKAGKRVLLERISFLWKHLNFTWKATVRNLFRYKKRFLMTVFGIGGCMALLLVGFGLRDSIMDIGDLQYKEIQRYDGIVLADEDASGSAKKALEAAMEDEEGIREYTRLFFQKMDAKNGKKVRALYLYVPEDVENFSEFVTFRDRVTQEEFSLDDEGLILSEKTARLLELEVGDTVTLQEEGKKGLEVKVSAICENYMQHYAYMTPALYEKCYGREPEYNDLLFTLNGEYQDQEEEVGRRILKQEGAVSISYTSSIAAQIEDMLGALDLVIVVLIISAGLLAFVVLYNLNNINITERKRELATIKVLGFYDMETSAYVFRENVILTLFGVGAGIVLGILLHQFVIVTVEVDACMFGRNINLPSFLYSALFTIGFSAFVNMVMHFKLKKIDMVESLKSVE